MATQKILFVKMATLLINIIIYMYTTLYVDMCIKSYETGLPLSRLVLLDRPNLQTHWTFSDYSWSAKMLQGKLNYVIA